MSPHRLFSSFSLLVALWLVLATAATAQPSNAADTARRHLVMVSFDGFRADYAERWQLAHFQQLAREGSQAQGLLPAYPSKTFPNHYSLVTGLYPGHHGLVDNTFYSPGTGSHYAISARTAVEDPRHYGGLPLWQHLQAHDLITASFFWVGSEAPIAGSYPTHYRLYDGRVPNEARIEQVLDWLALPEAERPRFITLYFSDVDSAAHAHGPLAPQTQAAAEEADRLLGLLLAGIDASPLAIDLLVVSDHGMYPVQHEEASYIALDTLPLPDDGSIVVSGQTQVQLYLAQPERIDDIHRTLQAAQRHFTVYRREDTPAHWHYTDHANIGELLLVADMGHVFVSSLAQAFARPEPRRGQTIGVHGYDAHGEPRLHGIFYARGPSIRAGVTLAPFENVHVFPFISHLFGIAPPLPLDGQLDVLLPLLAD